MSSDIELGTVRRAGRAAATLLLAGAISGCVHGLRNTQEADRKFAGSVDVKMDVLARGPNVEPMNAHVRQDPSGVALTIVEGGPTPAKPVEIDRGTCEKPGDAQYRLPPFHGGEYQTTLKGAKLEGLQDGAHAVVVWGSDGKRKRIPFACGALEKG
ncbi:MAG: hypothetical protein NVS2B3_15570 [Vulcanimicrobiaceae bacterium]